MSGYLGLWNIDDFVTFTVITRRVDTSAPTDADSDPAYRVYENETGTPILTGVMSLLDSSNTNGFYSERIELSAGNGFEVGKTYNIHISAAVLGVTGATVRNFQVRNVIPTDSENADALLDRSNGIETSFTLRQALRLVLSALAGKLSGAATTTVVIRDVNDAKNRITATVDTDGNRTSITTDVS